MSDLLDDLGATDRKVTRRERAARQRRVRRSESHEARRRRRRSAIVLSLAVAFISATATAFIPEFFKESAVVSDYSGPGTGEVIVEIPEGATGIEIAHILAEHGVVASSDAFVDAYKADPRATSIQPGPYKLKKKMSASGAVSALLDGGAKAEIKVTIPEGFTKKQVIKRLSSLLGVPEATVAAEADNAAALGLPEEAGGNSEGWFAPATYSFAPGTSVTDAMKTMVDKRVKILESLGVPRDKWQTTLIKASIVEKEVNQEEYRSKVARVIENRLVDSTETGGKLRMDSTVLYGVGKTGGSPTGEELKQDTPYNTYQHTGLPPTPIGAVGEANIKAVLAPADGPWLYFVTVNLKTGETKFATTYQEHLVNVAEYREWQKANPQTSTPSPTG